MHVRTIAMPAAALALAATGCASTATHTASQHQPVLQVQVYGTAASASLHYGISLHGVHHQTHTTVQVPFSTGPLQGQRSGEWVWYTARTSQPGTLGCRFTVDGKVVAQHLSHSGQVACRTTL